MRPEREQGLDWLRALAITMVLSHHLARGFLKGFVPGLLAEAWTGVDLFFVLSGFLVARSFARWLESRAGSPWWLAGRYCRRRLLRILPPAWLWAVLPWLGSVFFNRSGAFGAPEEVGREVVAVFLFYYNYFTVATDLGRLNQFWSLAVEEHFYVFLPIFLVLVRGMRARLRGFALIAIGVEALRIGARLRGHGFGELLFLTHFRADALAIGCFLGLLSPKRRFPGGGWLAAVAIAALWMGPALLGRSEVSYFGFTAFALLSAQLVWQASAGTPLLGGTWLAAIGRRSYSLYLIHVPLLHLFAELRFRWSGLSPTEPWKPLGPALIELGLFLIALAAVTELNYRFVEAPLIGMAREWFREPQEERKCAGS